MARLIPSKGTKFRSSSDSPLIAAAALSAALLLASCAAEGADSSPIVSGAPQSIPAISQETDCYILSTNAELPSGLQSTCGSVTEESEEQTSAGHMLGGGATTAETEKLAVTYYCAEQDDAVTFALIPNSGGDAITASGGCEAKGEHNDLVLSVPSEKIGEEFVFSSPYEFFTILSIFEWQ